MCIRDSFRSITFRWLDHEQEEVFRFSGTQHQAAAYFRACELIIQNKIPVSGKFFRIGEGDPGGSLIVPCHINFVGAALQIRNGYACGKIDINVVFFPGGISQSQKRAGNPCFRLQAFGDGRACITGAGHGGKNELIDAVDVYKRQIVTIPLILDFIVKVI